MSMHEFEDLVEYSVRLLDQSDQANRLDLRSMFWQLYEFQKCWDTGFTHFRVIDLLLKHRFVYRFGLFQHPWYSQYKNYFEELTRKEENVVTFIRPDPHAPRDRDSEPFWLPGALPERGYYKPPYLYCDAGSWLWEQFVAEGLLTGPDNLPPDKNISLIETAKTVVEEAVRQNDTALIRDWYWLLLAHFSSHYSEEQLDALGNDLDLREFVRLALLDQSKGELLSAQWEAELAVRMNAFPALVRVLRITGGYDDSPEALEHYAEVRKPQEENLKFFKLWQMAGGS